MVLHSSIMLTVALLVVPTFALRTSLSDLNEVIKPGDAMDPQCFECMNANLGTCFPKGSRHVVLFGEDEDALGSAFECMYDACVASCPMDMLDYHTNSVIRAGARDFDSVADCDELPASYNQSQQIFSCHAYRCVVSSVPSSQDGVFQGTIDEIKTKIKSMRNCLVACVKSGGCQESRIKAFVTAVFVHSMGFKHYYEHERSCTQCIGQKTVQTSQKQVHEECLPHDEEGRPALFGSGIDAVAVGGAFGCVYDHCAQECDMGMVAHNWDQLFSNTIFRAGTEPCEQCWIACIPDELFEGPVDDQKARITERIQTLHTCVSQCKETEQCTDEDLGGLNREVRGEVSWWARRD